MTVRCAVGRHGDATHVVVSGELDVGSYPHLRDTLLKLAADAPAAVLVDIGGLLITPPYLASVFPTVSMRVAEWPGVPIVLIADPGRRPGLAGHIGRFVRVCDTVEAATALLGEPPARRLARIRLSWETASSATARAFVRATLGHWGVADRRDAAELIATELVQNVLQHTASAIDVRVELRRGVLSVAVSDDDPAPAVRRESTDRDDPPLGLPLIASLATAWGCTPTATGKVVWGTLRVPSFPDRR